MSGYSLVKYTIVMKLEEHTIETEPRLNIVTPGKTTVKFDIASMQLIYREKELCFLIKPYICSECGNALSCSLYINEVIFGKGALQHCRGCKVFILSITK